MWLPFALLFPLLEAFVHVLDSYCVEDIFDRPWMGMVTSALSSIVIIAPFSLFIPFLSWEWTATTIIVMGILSGMLTQFSQAIYFQSLAYSEAGIVAAYWNMIPAIVAGLSYVFLREVLQLSQYVGIAILIVSSVSLCLIDTRYRTRWRTIGFMLVAASLQAMSYLIDEVVFRNLPFLQGLFLILTGIIITGLCPLLFSRFRRLFVHSAKRLMPAAKLFVAIEIVNLIAVFSNERAIDLGIPSLVSALETAIPAFTVLLGIAIFLFFPKYGDARAMQKITPKLGLIFCMMIGVVLLST